MTLDAEASIRPRQADQRTPALDQRTLPQAVWVSLFFAPVLGWISTVGLLASALRALGSKPLRAEYAQLSRGQGRLLATICLSWWLVLLAGDLCARIDGAWWKDLRFLFAILPALMLLPLFQQAAVTHRQIGQWATWSVWIAVTVTSLEYLIVVLGVGMIHHRPRALSGNALFVSTMLVPMMMLAWLGTAPDQGRRWVKPLLTYLAGVTCLSAVLGARASTGIAVLLLPLPLLWFRQGRHWATQAGWALLAMGAVVAVLWFIAPGMSTWYEERWGAVMRVISGADPSALADYGISTRAAHWPAAWRAFLERPWLGHGFLNEVAALARHLPAGTSVLPTAHQQYLSFMLWSGWPGLVTGLLVVALPILLALTAARSPQRHYAGWALGLPMLLHGLTDTVFDDLRIISFHLTMSVLLLAAADPGGEDGREPRIQTACG